MRLSNANTVDYLGTEKQSGAVLATLMDDFDGIDQEERLGLLKRKMDRYFDFIESGEIYSKASKIAARTIEPRTPVRIAIIARQRLDLDGERFLEEARGIASTLGATVSFDVVAVPEPGHPGDVRSEHS